MNSKVSKSCAVPFCHNTSKETPNKVFVYVPHNKTMRYKWLNLARRDPTSLCLNSPIYFCEDHFDLPIDMANYMEYHVMGRVSQVRMKPGCIPTKFECQPDRRKQTSNTKKRPNILKKQRKLLIEECQKDLPGRDSKHLEIGQISSGSQVSHTNVDNTIQEETKFECQPDRRKRTSNTMEQPHIQKKQRKILIEECEKDQLRRDTKHFEIGETSSGSPVGHTNMGNTVQETVKTADKSIQVLITHKFRSKAVQTEIKTVNQMTSPLRPTLKSVFTSPFKVKSCITSKPSTSSLQKFKKQLFTVEDQSDSDISYTPSIIPHRDSSPSTISLQMKSTSDCSELVEYDRKLESTKFLEYTVQKIAKDPRFFIGIPKNCYFLLDLIEENTKIPLNHILLCLKKIRLNNPFKELAYDFSITPTYASKIFLKNIPIIASVMRPFIVNLDKNLIKQNLPMAFRHKYHNVTCIIDCLEIEIQKPSKALNQSLTWSEYKKANTIKYLISCTPNGLVNYISPGYGGRITDTCLVETCDFIRHLQPGMCVMADRGFKHVEQYLRKQGVQLVRPPSVTTGAKLSKGEAKETKQIASLRIHVERVIRRLRESNMLRSHACVHHNLVKVLDDVITIACGLINLQDSLIK